MRYFCPFLNSQVDLTTERTKHIHEYHPDLDIFFERIENTLKSPDEIRESVYDTETLLFYKFYTDIFAGKYITVVVKRSKRNFILTTYLTDKIKEGKILWRGS